MPYNFAWYDPDQKIIMFDIHGVNTWDEHHAAIALIARELEATTQRIDVIFNNHSELPKGNPLPHFRAAWIRLSSYPNFGFLIVVTNKRPSTFLRMMTDMFLRLVGLNVAQMGGMVETLDEAVNLIMRDRTRTAIKK